MKNSELNLNQNEEVANDIGGEIDKSAVSLRFFDENLCIEEITQLLECFPSISYKMGDLVNNEITETGAWLLKGKKSSESLENQVSELFDLLSGDLKVWQELTAKYKADLFCGLWLNGWNRGTDLSSKILKQISDRGLKINLDIYCVEEKN